MEIGYDEKKETDNESVGGVIASTTEASCCTNCICIPRGIKIMNSRRFGA